MTDYICSKDYIEFMNEDEVDNRVCILTPTYNRAYILQNLYESLKRQSDQNFVWIIVDDGSSDETEKLVYTWIEANDVKLLYLKKSNGGKHRALNYAMPHINSEYTCIVDSDDYLVDDAIVTIKKWIEECRHIVNLAGVSGTRGKSINKEKVIGEFPKNKEKILASNLERYKYHLLGDKAEVYKTEFLKRYSFPEFEGEKFLAEGAVWNRIAYDGYKIMWYSKPIVICEYLPDGLTKTNKHIQFKKNLKGFILNYQLLWKGYSGILKYRAIIPFYNELKALGKENEIREYLNLKNYEYICIKVLSVVKRIFLAR